MKRLTAYFFLITVGLTVSMIYFVTGDGSLPLYAQTDGDNAGVAISDAAGDSGRPNPALCTQCFQKLQKDNRNCEALEGQDWQICRQAAESAYRQCGQGC